MRNSSTTLTIATLGLGPILAVATAAIAETPAHQSGTALTIYSKAGPGAIPPELYRPAPGMSYNVPHMEIPGYAVVKQERPVDLAEKVSTVRFSDVAARIDPTTVMFESLTDPAGTRVLEQSYQFDLVSAAKLMERYIDKTISVEQAHGDRIQTYTGTLLSSAQGIILRSEDGSVQTLQGYTAVRFPDLPGGLITRPTLLWRVAADKTGQHHTRVSYQTDGITWWSDYNVVYNDGADANSCVLDIGAWVSIINRSGASYNDAKLKLIAGDVARAPRPKLAMVRGKAMAADAFAMPEAAGFEEKAFFEYHLYTLGRPTTIPDNSTQQIELFPVARGVKAEKVLVYYGLPQEFSSFFSNPVTDRNYGNQSNKKVDIYLRFKNSKDNGMGMPLPAGRMRVSKQDPADKTLEFIGEDALDHTPKDEKLLIKLGSAFDVVGERRQTDFRVDTARNWMEESFEIKLRNHKKEPVKVIAKENLYRWINWEIKYSSHKYEKPDARTIEFPVEIRPDEEMSINYTVRYTW